MPGCFKILFLYLLFPACAFAQDAWPSPEVAQMYHHAQDYVALGNYKDAIITYRQAITLAPAKFVLYKELGKTLYLSGNYKDAVQTLQPLTGEPEADAACFQLLAESHRMLNEIKNAHTAVNKGLSRFPASGLLYNEQGVLYELEQYHERALDSWQEGIQKDPSFAPNYAAAAKACFASGDAIWGLLYGEIYLNISTDTAGHEELKNMLFIGYKAMFDNITGQANETHKKRKQKNVNTFEEAIKETYLSLTPVVSDGITTENLTMVRTRFIMDWMRKYGKTYPFSLFSYQDYLIRNGLFDIYNEWLYGKAESITEYKAWNEFHPVEMDIFLQKKKEHPLVPVATDAYGSERKSGKAK